MMLKIVIEGVEAFAVARRRQLGDSVSMRITIAIVLLSAACSGSADKITSLDGSKQVASLSKDEAAQLCTDLKSFKKKHEDKALTKRMRCSFEALLPNHEHQAAPASDDDAQKQCRKKRETCVAAPDNKADEEKPLECDDLTKQMADCPDVTIADFDACVHDQIDNPLLKTDLCTNATKSLTAEDLGGLLKKITSSSKCKVIEDKCKKKSGKGA